MTAYPSDPSLRDDISDPPAATSTADAALAARVTAAEATIDGHTTELADHEDRIVALEGA